MLVWVARMTAFYFMSRLFHIGDTLVYTLYFVCLVLHCWMYRAGYEAIIVAKLLWQMCLGSCIIVSQSVYVCNQICEFVKDIYKSVFICPGLSNLQTCKQICKCVQRYSWLKRILVQELEISSVLTQMGLSLRMTFATRYICKCVWRFANDIWRCQLAIKHSVLD